MAGRKEIPPPPEGPFSPPQVAKIVNQPYALINRWARTGLVVPSAQGPGGRGTWRLFSFADLVALKVASTLYRQGIRTARLRLVIKRLPSKSTLAHPLSHHRLVVRGDDVFLVEGERKAWSMLKKPGQGAFGFVLDLPAFAKEIRTHQIIQSKKAVA